MPKTLSPTDPNLLAAARRLKRIQQVWGLLLVALGALAQSVSGVRHPVSGMPLIAVGLFCLLWGDPALLAAVAALVALSIVPTINPRLTILGPDPLTVLADLSTVELAALVLGKLIVVLTAANQFFLYRFLYGTARATSDVPDLEVIPPMVPNRTNGLARSARLAALAGAISALIGLFTSAAAPFADFPRILAEMGGSLGAVAIGVGLGCAFSPTDERSAAIQAAALGLAAYVAAIAVLL